MKLNTFFSNLNESNKSYYDMFNDVLPYLPPKKQLEVKEMIKGSIHDLKRNDRIVWYLRFYKLQILIPTYAPDNKREYFSELYDKYCTYLQKKSHLPDNFFLNAYNNVSDIDPKLWHFLSLPIPAIQNYIFKWQSPDEVFNFFNQEEKKWIESRKEHIIPKSEDKIILQFPDKSAWFLLPRGSCEDEANAMGHCGNVPTVKPGQRILSYRTFKNKQWYVHLTFILDQDGYLGEMKGRGNDKPVPKYFPYIVDLLIQGNKSRLIKGIKGGGYIEENNFNIEDLDHNLFQKLAKNVDILDYATDINTIEKTIINNEVPLTEENQEKILKKFPTLIYTLLKNGIKPSEKTQFLVVSEVGRLISALIKYGIKPSEKVQLGSINSFYGDGSFNEMIRNGFIPCEKAQIAACKQRGRNIFFLTNAKIKPSEEVCMAAIESDGYALKFIMDIGIKPTEEMIRYACEKYPYVILDVIRNGIIPSNKIINATLQRYSYDHKDKDLFHAIKRLLKTHQKD